MKDERVNKIVRFPVGSLTAALVLTGIVLVAIAWSGVNSFRNIVTVQGRDLHIAELRDDIVRLDEVLTMSARMAAATGESDWEQRYRRFEPQLDGALKEAMLLTAHSNNAQAAAQIDAANLKLVEMEDRSFALVRAGKAAQARAILLAEAYEEQKAIYAQGTATLIHHLNEQLAANQHKQQREALFSIFEAALCIMLLFFALLLILAKLKRVHKELFGLNATLQMEAVEHTRVAEELQWKTAFLEAQVNSTLDGILVVDQQGKKILQNQCLVDLLRIPQTIADDQDDEKQLRWVRDRTRNPEEFVEKVVHLYSHPNEISRDEIELKDGTILDRYSSPVVGKNGKYFGRIWTFRDITQRKRAEEAMVESDERFSGAFEHAPIGVALVLPDGRWLKVNRAMCDLVGYSEDELLTGTFQDITHPEDLEGDLENVRRMIAGEIRSYDMEKRYVHRCGHLVTVLLSVSLVRDSQGQPRYFISQIQDISERKRAQEALLASQKRLRDLIDGLGPSMFVGLMTPQGILIECNRPALAAAGLKPEDVLGKPFAETYWWTYSPEVQLHLREAIARAAGGKASRYDVRVRVAESQFIDVEFSLQPVWDETGEVVFLVPSGNVITERKQAENALRESSEKFHQLADNITDAFWIRSPDMREVHYVSPAFERIWGRSVASLYADPQQWADYILPEDRELVLSAFAALTGDKTSLDIEYRIVRPDGEIRWIRVRGFQVRDASNKLIRHIGIVTDITDHRQTEEALRESQARFKLIFDSVPLGISLVLNRPDGTLTRLINDAHLRVCGLTREQADVGENFLRLSHPDDQSRQSELSSQILAGKIDQFSMEKRCLTPDGRLVWVVFSYQRRNHPDGSFDELTTVVDITALKKAQEEAAYERELLRVLLEHSPDTIYFKDAQSRFLKASKALAEHCGVNGADELVGATDFDFYTEEHARSAFEDEQEIIRTGRALIGKAQKEVLKDGREFWVLTSKMPLRNKDGQIIGTFGISKDITPIKEAETRLEQVHRQLVEASRRAGMAEAATGVLHNVGNVLNSVNVASFCLANSLKKSKAANLSKVVALLREHETDLGVFLTSDPKGKQVPGYLGQLAEQLALDQAVALKELDQLQKNIEHVKEVVTVQQRLAKGAGKSEMLQMTDLVEDTLRMDSSGQAHGDIEVIREFGHAPAIRVQKHKVLQILMNLVRNARQSCHEAGLPEKRMTLSVTNGDGRVRIAVSDNGVSISPENLARVFAHGFTTKEDGHSFGLHSAALAAKEMGGELRVHSDGVGRGATFTLELPLAREAQTHQGAGGPI